MKIWNVGENSGPRNECARNPSAAVEFPYEESNKKEVKRIIL